MDNQKELDNLFAAARTEKVVHSFEDAKTMFTASLASAGKINTIRKKYFTTKNWIIMLTTISAISAAVLLLTNGKDNKNKVSIAESNVTSNGQSILETNAEETSKPNVIHASFAMIEKGIDEMNEIMIENQSEGGLPPAVRETGGNRVFDWSKKYSDDEPYQFPVLTEKEIEATKKKKKAMLKALQKYDKNVYAYIPSGTFDYDSAAVSVQAFYMSKTEVTNFEYRTFLFDLLMQDRKDEFLKAKPDQDNWSDIGGKPYEDYYFSHESYNEFPVVNISKEGAELYCKWLSAELRKFVGVKKEGNYNDIRLPYRSEWVKAASVEGKQLPYPWNGPYMRNSKGLYQANFSNEDSDNTATVGSQDLMASAKSYFPNEYDLYNMSGNVAEMVLEDNQNNIVGTAGGGWRNNAEQIKIYAEDTHPDFKGSAVDIGFRVVSTSLK